MLKKFKASKTIKNLNNFYANLVTPKVQAKDAVTGDKLPPHDVTFVIVLLIKLIDPTPAAGANKEPRNFHPISHSKLLFLSDKQFYHLLLL